MDETKALRKRVVLKGLGAGAILVLWWALFSRYSFVWSASYLGENSGYVRELTLAVVSLLSIRILCWKGPDKWIWSFCAAVGVFLVVFLVAPYLPGRLSLFYGAYHFHSDSRAFNRLIFRSLFYGYENLAAGTFLVWLIRQDRALDDPTQKTYPAMHVFGKGFLLALLFLAALILSLCFLAIDDLGVSIPLLWGLLSVGAGLLGSLLLCWGGSSIWRRAVLAALALFSVGWLAVSCLSSLHGFFFAMTYDRYTIWDFFLSGVVQAGIYAYFSCLGTAAIRAIQKKL